MKVLIVDDSAMMRRLIGRALGAPEDADIQVLEASDGMQALAMIEQHGKSIALVLCDLNMPNVDGLSLLRSLRNSPEFRHIPFIVVTADEANEAADQALREGAAGVIGKPFRPEVIAALVHRRSVHGRRATSSVFRTDTIARMARSMSRSARKAGEQPRC